MIKICKDCGTKLAKDRKSGNFWCVKCREVKDVYYKRYKIVVLGKNVGRRVGRFNIANCLVKYWKKEGHEVVELSMSDLYKIIPSYDFDECIRIKKPINIKMIEYQYSPDFIFIAQMYYRFDRNDVKTPVIYQHREYTHFADILKPDMLFAPYPYRLEIFNLYHPYEFNKILYRDYNLVAVDLDYHEPKENKELFGIYHIGLGVETWQFAEVNGPFSQMAYEDMDYFTHECVDNGYCEDIPTGLDVVEFHKMLSRCEAILINNGRFNILGRRIFEAMASKTLCVIRIYNEKQEDFYKEIGLTEDICYFIHTPKEVGDVKYTKEEWKTKVNNAYEWVCKNHTYEVRAREVLEKFEEWKNGVEKKPEFMGYALHNTMSSDGKGGVTLD